MSQEVENNQPFEDDEIRPRRNVQRPPDETMPLNINSLMDLMTIILTFLLMNIENSPVQINQNEDLRLPWSTTELPPEDMMTISITKRWVMVEEASVIPINEGQIDPSAFQSADSAIIPELQQRIEEVLTQQEQWARQLGRDQQKVAIVIADEAAPYRVITQVMMTAAAAGIQNFKFAVIQREQGSGVQGAGGA
jgi:biopolymer transport protein ExbD